MERFTRRISGTGQTVKLPILQVLLNGGPNSAETCAKTLENDIPLLVIKGRSEILRYINSMRL